MEASVKINDKKVDRASRKEKLAKLGFNLGSTITPVNTHWEPIKPMQEPVKPVQEPVKPVQEPVKPVQERVVVSEPEVKPMQERVVVSVPERTVKLLQELEDIDDNRELSYRKLMLEEYNAYTTLVDAEKVDYGIAKLRIVVKQKTINLMLIEAEHRSSINEEHRQAFLVVKKESAADKNLVIERENEMNRVMRERLMQLINNKRQEFFDREQEACQAIYSTQMDEWDSLSRTHRTFIHQTAIDTFFKSEHAERMEVAELESVSRKILKNECTEGRFTIAGVEQQNHKKKEEAARQRLVDIELERNMRRADEETVLRRKQQAEREAEILKIVQEVSSSTTIESPTKVVSEDVSLYHDSCISEHGDLVIFNMAGGIIGKIQASSFKCNRDSLANSGSQLRWELGKDEYLIVNPTCRDQMKPCSDYLWIVKELLLGKKWKIDTDWKLEFVETIPDEPDKNVTYVIPKLGCMSPPNGIHVLPMLETIHHTHQEFYPMTLIQIATCLERQFIGLFKSKVEVCKYLYAKFKDEFDSICQVERIPIEKIHKCEFKATYKYIKSPELQINTPKKARTMENVTMLAASYLESSTSYGNYPWSTSSKAIFETGVDLAPVLFSPFIFFKDNSRYNNRPTAARYDMITVFPSVVFRKKYYNSGSYIGVVGMGNDVSDIVIRGDLFEDLSVKEYYIIIEIYRAFKRNMLGKNTAVTSIYKEVPLSDEDNTIREDFITLIMQSLLGTTKDQL